MSVMYTLGARREDNVAHTASHPSPVSLLVVVPYVPSSQQSPIYEGIRRVYGWVPSTVCSTVITRFTVGPLLSAPFSVIIHRFGKNVPFRRPCVEVGTVPNSPKQPE